ncbi:hypothetical protein B0J12DRAFT_59681 [Macrophomina phaseolina]|uniref:Uncharacterized protein n=1 Tax=Macrophomina phaseolina TaxID=35725 RepID=A0ABQ8FQ35_9PEZI|nr:hypothetical protein B0J12DRAFT_59681 [Macrophomina phaseolina]
MILHAPTLAAENLLRPSFILCAIAAAPDLARKPSCCCMPSGCWGPVSTNSSSTPSPSPTPTPARLPRKGKKSAPAPVPASFMHALLLLHSRPTNQPSNPSQAIVTSSFLAALSSSSSSSSSSSKQPNARHRKKEKKKKQYNFATAQTAKKPREDLRLAMTHCLSPLPSQPATRRGCASDASQGHDWRRRFGHVCVAWHVRMSVVVFRE